MVTRRNFLASAAAVAAAPVQVLAVPVGGPLRIPSGFTKGKAIPDGVDFRDPFSGLFMSFSLWYVVGESGTAELSGGYPTPEAAYAAYLATERAGAEAQLNQLLSEKLAPHENYERELSWCRRTLAEIDEAQKSPVAPAYFTDDTKKADLGVRMDENYMGSSVVRGDMTYEFVRRYAADESYGGGPEAVADVERAQNDPEWCMTWGGGC